MQHHLTYRALTNRLKFSPRDLQRFKILYCTISMSCALLDSALFLSPTRRKHVRSQSCKKFHEKGLCYPRSLAARCWAAGRRGGWHHGDRDVLIWCSKQYKQTVEYSSLSGNVLTGRSRCSTTVILINLGDTLDMNSATQVSTR